MLCLEVFTSFFLCLCIRIFSVFFFFFSSRRRHTRWPRDWSSDVCSSDLTGRPFSSIATKVKKAVVHTLRSPVNKFRSEERREGKSVDLGGRRITKKKKRKRKKEQESEKEKRERTHKKTEINIKSKGKYTI